VEPIELTTYREADLYSDPVIFLACGHFYSVGSLDRHMDLRSAYEINEGGEIFEPKKFPTAEMKACPECRAPLRNIHRYNRIVNKALLSEATKRFMAHAGALQAKMVEDIEVWEKKLEDSTNEFAEQVNAQNAVLISKDAKIILYKKNAAQATRSVTEALAIVAEAEKPYSRVQR